MCFYCSLQSLFTQELVVYSVIIYMYSIASASKDVDECIMVIPLTHCSVYKFVFTDNTGILLYAKLYNSNQYTCDK